MKKQPHPSPTPAQSSPLPKAARRTSDQPFLIDSRPQQYRVIEIHEALACRFDHPNQTLPPLNCSTLAKQFGKGRQTVLKDLDYMRDTLKLPIDWDQPRNTYFYTEKVTHLPLTQITHREVSALVLAKLALESFHCPAVTESLKSALDKLMIAFSEELLVDMRRMEARISFRPSGHRAKLDYEHFMTVYQALHDEVELDMSYCAASGANAGKPVERTVQPRHLTCHENAWYLFTDDLLSGEDRTFLLSRIGEAKSTGRPFKPKSKFNLKKALDKNFGIYSGTKKKAETVRLICDQEIRQFIVERHWHDSQEITPQPDGTVELKMEVIVQPEFERWIYGWGGRARVLEPAELAEKVRAAGRRMAAG